MVTDLVKWQSSRNGYKTRFQEFLKSIEKAKTNQMLSLEETSLLMRVKSNIRYILANWDEQTEVLKNERSMK